MIALTLTYVTTVVLLFVIESRAFRPRTRRAMAVALWLAIAIPLIVWLLR